MVMGILNVSLCWKIKTLYYNKGLRILDVFDQIKNTIYWNFKAIMVRIARVALENKDIDKTLFCKLKSKTLKEQTS